MTFKRLEVGIAVRLLGLLTLLLGLSYTVPRGAYLLAVVLAGLLAGAVVELTRYLTRPSRALADYLLAVRYRDFAQHYNDTSADRALQPLYQAFNELNRAFRQLSAEREAQFAYLQTVLQLIDTGILSFDEHGQVEWVNEAFKQTLELPYLKTVQALQKRHPVLYDAIQTLQPGTPTIVRLSVGPNTMQLLLSTTAFRLQQRQFTLVAFKNVSHALEETETAAWQKLLRVMTHEIMNSVAPIASLADTLRRHVHQELAQASADQPAGAHGLLDDVAEGIGIIQNRSEGLLRFAQVYRDLSTISAPLLTTVYVQELFGSIRGLMRAQLEAAGISLLTAVEPPDLCLPADTRLLEQVLINLVLNAAHAVGQNPQPRIELRAQAAPDGRVLMLVLDNGTGIATELLDSIFIPFFTTRKDGTGIGLSLAKQIMHLHKGSIRVQSKAGGGAVFQLEFPKA